MNLRGDGELAPSHAGAIGAWFAARMVGVFGFVISTLLVGPLAIGAFLMATDFFFYRYIDEVWFARARVATPQRGEVTVDTGVEPAVTEYFKGLASPSPRASGAGFLARAGALMPRAEREEGGSLMAGELDDGAATTAGADAETEVRPLRRERRHRSSWARRSEEPAEPMAAAPDEPFGTEAPRDEPAEPEPMVESAPATVSPWTESVSRATDATGTGGDDWSLGAAVPDHEYDDEETGGLADTNSSGRNAAGNAAGNAATGGAAAEGEPDSASAAGQAQHGIDLPFDPEPAGAGADAADGTGPVRADASASAAGDGDEDDDSLADRLADAELAEDGDEVSDEPVVAIPRPPEGARQRRLFGSSQVDPSLVAEARELVLSTRRASATHLQRKLRVEFEQAMELLSILGRDGVIEIAAGDTQGRVLQ
ncbi:MAG TPA: DNA translocase FtsK [Planctomycetota bacterium]|nr:DNA translocase FtsK [Planctomycetota bacterium]